MTVVVAAAGPTPLWYAARGSGLVCLLLLTASIVLGTVTTARWSNERWPRFSVSFVHRNLSLLAVAFLVVHAATMVLDGFAPIGWKDTVIPFLSPYRALWLGLGVLAFDLLIAVVVTSLLRNRVGARVWRTLHWFTYLLWALAVLHGLGAGTDTRTALLLIANAACVVAVMMAVWWRCAIARPARPAVRGVALTATVILPIALVGWLVVGPLAAGWARRAGTPSALLGGTPSPDVGAAASGPADGTLGPSFAAGWSGTITTTGSNAQIVATVTGRLERGASGSILVVLHGSMSGTGSLVVHDGTVTLTNASGRTTFRGTVVDVPGNALIASPTSSSASGDLAVQFDTFDVRGGTATGTVQVVAPARGDDFNRGDDR